MPVLALATAQRDDAAAASGWCSPGSALFLALGLLTIIGAAVRESVVPPGDEPDPARRRRRGWRR